MVQMARWSIVCQMQMHKYWEYNTFFTISQITSDLEICFHSLPWVCIHSNLNSKKHDMKVSFLD